MSIYNCIYFPNSITLAIYRYFRKYVQILYPIRFKNNNVMLDEIPIEIIKNLPHFFEQENPAKFFISLFTFSHFHISKNIANLKYFIQHKPPIYEK